MSKELTPPTARELAEIKTPDEADLFRRKVEAFIAVAEKAPVGQIEVEWPALLRLRLDSWRKWGEKLGRAEHGRNQYSSEDSQHTSPRNHDDEYRARKLAFKVPDDAYFKYRAREDTDRLTLAGALRLVPPDDPDNPPPPEGQYKALVVDPPWPIKRIERSEQRPNQPDALDYQVMPTGLDQSPPPPGTIAALPIPDLAHDAGCHIYLWTTHRFMPAALELFKVWGVSYECQLTWVKNVGITPFSWMYDTEPILFGRIGSLEVQRKGLRLSIHADAVGHSVKPDAFYDKVAEASPGPRLELFTRRPHEGFEPWGNEVQDAA